ncbi:MAG: serine hydroxymethyltransferase [Gemmatimonadetes bacterium]|jgi:glycine hydroxymethyltransferase|nr:serine hydroxymethyltransferase [Gemmatimonadota bacterium]MBT4611199.1 serine hydroxymethyltransferase [Gemmatimonadota bacterium]MBT5056554.1 serine hydroxymethyltransferase [Gemmatimonadota bacterium]MBT5145264.1 serine hydroxymethyltransferase [Gemmatimonadota bacterium]MBT5589645.1 serine hydroxymethyltransferase [Gemmatimonadota bacterium]
MSRLDQADPEVSAMIAAEQRRQHAKIRLIPSENYVTQAVLDATGSILTNKYSEGYPGDRYYEGQQQIDKIEQLAIDRARALFGAEHINVQPYSGSPANQAVYVALAQPGDTVMGLSLAHGGHLTHGAGVSISGLHYNAVQYGVDVETGYLDYDEIEKLAVQTQPKLIFCGTTAYPRILDFERFAAIGKKVGALVVADIAHIAGLVATGVHPSPVDHVDVVTTTTHKSLRGPRGGMIMCRKQYAQAIDKAVFPGLQGGPHNHTTAAVAVALKEADTDEFRRYAQAIVDNAQILGAALMERGFGVVSGGTDNHLLLIDMSTKSVTGNQMSKALDAAGIVCNYNLVPGDTRSARRPSGIRIGTPAITSRGFGANEMLKLADWMNEVAEIRADASIEQDARRQAYRRIAEQVRELCDQFPAPGIDAPNN